MTQMTAKQIAEYDCRDFLTEEVWKKWKVMYDEAMAYRKTLKGKPTEEQRIQLDANAAWIDFCDRVLWHSPRLGKAECPCKSCDEKRKMKK